MVFKVSSSSEILYFNYPKWSDLKEELVFEHEEDFPGIWFLYFETGDRGNCEMSFK